MMSPTRVLSFSWAVSSDPGLRRASNEDCYCTRPDVGLFVVADGMGGHVAGEVASRVAVEAIEAFTEETAGADRNRTWPFPFDPSLSLEANRLKAAFRLANRRIAAAIADSQDLRGMATTASALLAGSSTACVAHVGDSRVYVFRNHGLAQLTHDHSWVEEQVRAGTMTPAPPDSTRGAMSSPERCRGARIQRWTLPKSALHRVIVICSARMACSPSSPITRSRRS
jgi:serine/threonine protein phosphatase PrpC